MSQIRNGMGPLFCGLLLHNMAPGVCGGWWYPLIGQTVFALQCFPKVRTPIPNMWYASLATSALTAYINVYLLICFKDIR